MEQKMFVCECCSLEHQMTFWYDKEENSLYTEVHLITYAGFFKRLKYAVKYLFGYKCRFGSFDEFLFKPKDVVILEKFLNKINKKEYVEKEEK